MLIRSIIANAKVLGNRDAVNETFEQLYRFKEFRHILDLALHVIQQKRLSFELTNRTFLDRESGLCISSGNKTGDKVHTVRLKERYPHILVHELAHLTEKELRQDLHSGFLDAIKTDMLEKRSTNKIVVQNIIKQIMVIEVTAYPPEKKPSEFFARFYELHARTKEVEPNNQEHLCKLADIVQFFNATTKWAEEMIIPKIEKMISPEILAYSRSVKCRDKNMKITWASRLQKQKRTF